LDMATSLRQGQARWAETRSKMVNLGAQGTQEEFAAILKYLVQYYGGAEGEAKDPTVPAGLLLPATLAGTAGAPGSRGATVASKLPKLADAREIASVAKGNVPADRAKEWWTYGHDSGALRFSPLKQITPRNVNRLQVAWVYHMRPEGFTGASSPDRFPEVMEGRGPAGRPVGDEPPLPASPTVAFGRGRMQFGSGFRPSSVTPLVIRGIMYLTTPYSRVAALDPINGKELWSYQLPSGNPSTRGLEYWPGDGKTPAQVVFGSSDEKLHSGYTTSATHRLSFSSQTGPSE
jgi:quinoprotein glucose dehydrogenase